MKIKPLFEINQKHVVDTGLVDRTDLIDWVIIDYIKGEWGKDRPSFYKGHVLIDLKTLCSMLPLCKLNSKQAASRRIKKLSETGLIGRIYDSENKLYVKVLKAGMV